MNLNNFKNIYFLGIGGIGMSALARYFHLNGKSIAGYDKTPTPLTMELEDSGINIHYEDNIECISDDFLKKKDTQIIYTPAIPDHHKEFQYFKEKGFSIAKRSQIVGQITSNKTTIAVAGTHGKTTVSSMIAYILSESEFKCNALLGGIAKNFNSNLTTSDSSNLFVVEADEYDRSFLQLHPSIAVITAIDADHLDIYGSKTEVENSFKSFVEQIKQDGILLIKEGVNLFTQREDIKIFTYSLDKNASYYAKNIKLVDGIYHFDIVTPVEIIPNLTLPHPGLINVENAVAAVAVSTLVGMKREDIRQIIENFEGIKRRIDIQINSDRLVFIDDYAHHPAEIDAVLRSVRKMFPHKKITGIFQPHLYSRTRDFADEFAESLSQLDELIMLDIYPAREIPIEGVSSEMIFEKVTIKQKEICKKNEVLNLIRNKNIEVLLTLGAGDIDTLVDPIKNYLKIQYRV